MRPGSPSAEIVGLPDIVEHEQLDHHVMHAVRPRFNHGEAVMTRVQMEEITP